MKIIHYLGQNAPLDNNKSPKILNKESITNSTYIQLYRIAFQEQCDNTGNMDTRTWDIVQSHDSVAILLFDTTKECFIFVRQLRVSVFLKNPNHGYVYELCAGLCDKNKSIEEIALEEIEEECGYHISQDKLQKIGQFYNSVGMSGAIQNLFYAPVSMMDKTSEGGGKKEEGENIDLIYVPCNLIDEFLQDKRCPITQSLAFALLWFQQRQTTQKNHEREKPQ